MCSVARINTPRCQFSGISPLLSISNQHQNKAAKMMKIIVLVSALVAIAAAKPAIVSAPVVAASAPLVAAPAPFVTATSSQYYHRINNGLAAYVAAPAAYVASPYVAAAAPYVASPYVSSAYVTAPYSAPIVAV